MTPRSPPASGSSSLGAGGDQADHVEGADQIDLDHLAEHVERVRSVLADRLQRDRDAGAVDQDARRRRARFADLGDRRFGILGARHVAFERDAAELGRDLFGTRQPDVEDRDPGAPGGKRASRRLAQSRAAAGDDRNLA